jgi:hypothetical protein
MGMTLAGAKPKLEQDLYKAFNDAYMSQFSMNVEAGKYMGESQKCLEDAADKFAKELSKSMAQAIYDFVKEIGIQATLSGTVISPSGPCTGALPPTSFTIM